MHPSKHIVKFTLEVGDPTHSTELKVFTREHHLINIKGGNRPVTHQRILVLVFSNTLMEVSHGHLGWGLRDLVPELVVIGQLPLPISRTL